MGSGPLISDADFYAALDLSMPEFSDVAAGVASQDYEAADAALLAAIRKRRAPRYFVNWWERAEGNRVEDALDEGFQMHKALVSSAAEEICKHNFTVLSKPPYKMGQEIDWAASPYGDREWAWVLNRHGAWATLGKAYWAAGDEKYAREFVAQLAHWITSQPIVTDGTHNSSAAWRTIEAGIRMFTSWPAAYQYFLQSPSFTPAAHTLMLKSMLEHARHLAANPTGRNWLTMECNGLFHIGILHPEFREAEAWRETAFQRLDTELTRQVYPDGMQKELTTGYHMVCLHSFTVPLDLAELNGESFPHDYKAKLLGLYEACMYLTIPNLHLPALNDSDPRLEDPDLASGVNAAPWLETGARIFSRPDMTYVRANGQEGKPPEDMSHAFPYAGLYVMRSGWDRDARYAIFDAGPYGAAHQHEDKLNLEVYAYGETLIFDPGRYAYAPGPFHDYFVGAAAHNIVMVDGQGQNRRGQPPDERKWVVTELLHNPWESNELFDYAAGTYDEGYGPDRDKSVSHKREVLFVKPDYWLVVDRLCGSGSHRIETLWHFGPGKARVDAESLVVETAHDGRPNITISLVESAGVRLSMVEGREEPVQGWLSTDYNVKLPSPVAAYLWEGLLPKRFSYLLTPRRPKKDAAPNATVHELPDGGLAYVVKWPDGAADWCLLAYGIEGVKRFGDFETDAQLMVARMDSGGVLKNIHLWGGS